MTIQNWRSVWFTANCTIFYLRIATQIKVTNLSRKKLGKVQQGPLPPLDHKPRVWLSRQQRPDSPDALTLYVLVIGYLHATMRARTRTCSPVIFPTFSLHTWRSRERASLLDQAGSRLTLLSAPTNHVESNCCHLGLVWGWKIHAFYVMMVKMSLLLHWRSVLVAQICA
jgi:hypothetical protein